MSETKVTASDIGPLPNCRQLLALMLEGDLVMEVETLSWFKRRARQWLRQFGLLNMSFMTALCVDPTG